MPKMKTKKAALKRFKATGTGKLTYHRANKQHINGHKTPKRMRRLRHAAVVSKTNERQAHRMLPYI
jgi:large subunit ribosomal protein L35